jgi:hypothetical protein
MKKITLIIFFITSYSIAKCQLDQGNWLAGGSASLSFANGETTNNVGVQKSNYTDLSVLPDVGYFLIDKLAVGLKPGFTFHNYHYEDLINNGNVAGSGGHAVMSWFDIGPFVRYYFLPNSDDQRVNLLAEANYSHGWANQYPGKGDRDNYSLYGGPVVFFNSTAALEFLIGYSSSNTKTYGLNTSQDDIKIKRNSLRFSLGFQIYLQNK